jgi:small-conductance mechanosensitive channel
MDALGSEAWILHEKPVQVLLLKFTDHGVKLKVRCWIENYMETRISEDRLNTAIYTALIGKKVAMPSSELIIYFGNPEDKKIIFESGE